MTARDLSAVPLERIGPLVRGAVSLARTATAVAPQRLPERAIAQLPDPFAREVFRMTSGVRLLLTTDANVLEVDVALSRMRSDADTPSGEPAVFDLVVDGELRESAAADAFAYRVFDTAGTFLRHEPAPAVTLRFAALDGARARVELWFPADAAVEVRGLRADAPLEPSAVHRPRWIHYGSSISHCLEANRPTETWPAVAARLGAFDLLNLGVAGNCQLDQCVARTIRDEPAACISLKVGINIVGSDSLKRRTFGPAMHGFLDTVRDGHPETPVLLVSPIICPALETTPVAADGLSLVHVREILAEIVEHRAGTGEALDYVDGLQLFGEADLAELPDGLHPSPAGYRLIGARFAESVFGGDLPSWRRRAVPRHANQGCPE